MAGEKPPPSYIHARLTSTLAIRVLILEPARHRSDPLHGAIQEIEPSQNDCLAYEALSYVWGQSERTQALYCNDETQLNITPNCELALRFLRHTRKHRVLWVDSICINQDDTAEKDEQVQMMGTIYQKASRVLAWIGPADHRFVPAFRLMRWSAPLSNYSRVGMLCYRVLWRLYKIEVWLRRLWYTLFPGQDRISTSGEARDFLRDLVQQPYFSRAWTIQEVALAREVVLVSGQWERPWRTLELGQQTFAAMYPSWFTSRRSIVPQIDRGLSNQVGMFQDHLFCRIATVKPMTKPYMQSPFPGEWRQEFFRVRKLVPASRSHASSDIRDRVWGMYSVYRACGIRLPAPDYGKYTAAALYRDATRAIIRDTESLTTLDQLSSDAEHMPGLPSWAHDFRHALETVRDQNYWWKPSGTSRFNIALLDEGDRSQLHLQGIKLSTVTQCGEPLPNASDGLADDTSPLTGHMIGLLREPRRALELARQHVYGYPGTGETAEDAFGQLLFYYMSRGDNPPLTLGQGLAMYRAWSTAVLSVESQPLTREAIEAAHEAAPELCKLSVDRDWIMYATKLIHTRIQENSLVFPLIGQVLACHQGKRFFVSDDGRFGFGPKTLEPMDQVVLFAGATRPMVIRLAESGLFTLVGPALVHGVMAGEVWPKDGTELKTFILT